ncbi:MAG: GNAT family N-acetyltransferase [Proteobacteria bacterium]|nr:GNAT family N-acetyltransferase [Pseudomonadota bacterium]
MKTPKPWMKTPRIALRQFTRADAGDIAYLDSDPRVMRYINGGKPSTPAEVAATMSRVGRNYWLYPGLGTWRAELRDNGAFIGWFSLKYIPRTPDIEVGYRLVHEAWGRGLATEGASALVRYGFETLELERIIGITHAGNRASQNVLMKVGLVPNGWAHYYDQRVRLYVGTRKPA